MPGKQPSSPRPAAAPAITLDSPLTYVKGVGEARARLFARLGLKTAGDLLTFYPRRWEDRSVFARIGEVPDGQSAVFQVRVIGAENRRTNSGKTLTRVTVEDGTGQAGIVYFNQPWLRDKFLRMRGQTVAVYGTIGRQGFDWSAELRDAEFDDTGGALMLGRIVPFYNLTEGLQQNAVRKVTLGAVPVLSRLVPELLPEPLRERRRLMPVGEAFREIHWPSSFVQRDAARRRLVFEELFLLQVALAVRRKHETLDIAGIRFDIPEEHLDEFAAGLPYPLTGAQRRVIGEILGDMRQPRPMNRLLQGDVGSGKTVVAAAAVAAAAKAGYQSAVMAPTEILAEQHYRSFRSLLEPLGFTVELLKGSMKARTKREAQAGAAIGLSDVVVGTHALIQDAVTFRNLGLVVVDEQHRFGVLQRAALRAKGDAPDVLVMTATPIPRTLALVVYGDLDISVIDEMPPGRKPIVTHLKSKSQRQQVYQGVEKLLAAGRQAYVVCPLIEESDKLQSEAATALYEQLQRRVFPHRRVGLLHGQMSPAEKEAAMEAFRNHETDILVATTVIEVGVDVPNATCMVVEDAERFGLSQLHQLRGRVGRGDKQSFCILISSQDDVERLNVMAGTSDGFVIAQEDLRLRGPGEFYGTRQSGLPSFRIANIVEDVAILDEAREEAFALVASDPDLSRPENRDLAKEVSRLFADTVLATVS